MNMSLMKYTLMNKTYPVLDFLYDEESCRITSIVEVHDAQHASPAILDRKGNPARKELNDWWRGRAIPATRDNIEQIRQKTAVKEMASFLEKNHGLSLSDRYWIYDREKPVEWKDINFFDHAFSDTLGMMTLGQDYPGDPDFFSPNSSLNGDLVKAWEIQDGMRILLKGGRGFVSQEVYNEVVASALHGRILDYGEFVPYALQRRGGKIYCACPNMLAEDEELVPMHDLLVNWKKPNDRNDFQFLMKRLESIGISGGETALCKMFVSDFIIANHDRHYRNFGMIRNVETLQYIRIAPIYDSGNSLWCNQQFLDCHENIAYRAKPFGVNGMEPERQISLFHDFSWLDVDALKGFSEEAAEILLQNPNMPAGRIHQIKSLVEANIQKLIKMI